MFNSKLWRYAVYILICVTVLNIQPVRADNFTAGTYTELRDAILAANANGQPDTITLTADILMPGGFPRITSDITIEGAGFMLDGSNGSFSDAAFEVYPSGTLSLNAITIYGVEAFYLGAIGNIEGTININNSTIANNYCLHGGSIMDCGGGLSNDRGVVNISNTTFSDNTSPEWGGGLYSKGGIVNISNSTFSGNRSDFAGGGICSYYNATVNINNSTFFDNEAYYGGGILNEGTVNISNSTFSGNLAGEEGGGIANGNIVNISNSTFSGNLAGEEGGGIYNGVIANISNSSFSGNGANSGGSIYNGTSGTVTIQNSITNSPDEDCTGPITSTNTLSSDGSCGGAPVTHFDTTLADNGGPTLTHMIDTGSNALEAVPAGACTYLSSGTNPLFADGAPILTDQRGAERAGGSASDGGDYCDIGAVEGNSSETPNDITVRSFAAQSRLSLPYATVITFIVVIGIISVKKHTSS